MNASSKSPMRWLRRLATIALMVGFGAVLVTCSPAITLLDKIRATGTLRMATVNSATTYYLAGSGPTGFEYDLAKLWADDLDLELEVIVVPDREQAIAAVENDTAHFAAGLAVTPERQARLRFTQTYASIKRQVIWRSRGKKPTKVADLDGKLTLPGDLATADWLKRKYPDLKFSQDPDANSEELLVRVAEKKIDYTIADSNLVNLNQRYYPSLRVAFDLKEDAHMAWAFAPDEDTVLYNKAVAFLAKIDQSQQMKIIVDRYYGHAERLGFVGGKSFARQVEERLPKWRKHFQKAGEKQGFDWRLLAAVGYQESHWDPNAVSPTGVRGLMMLTNQTAKEMRVDRLNPLESISGGARYLDGIRKRMPEMDGRLGEPDHTWMSLAAYNIGFGHLMDARRLVQAGGGNPDRWIEVRDALPKLTQERYFSKTRYGYARGHEAVGYVGNIRAYYDILLWMTSDEQMEIPETLTEDAPETPTPAEEKALSIDIPTL